MSNSKEQAGINFENTETGFGYKSDQDLRKAKFLFSAMKYNWLVKAGTLFIPLAIKCRLPVNGILRNTIFKQFVSGETLADIKPVLQKLDQHNVKAILDYGAEGKEDENGFDRTSKEFQQLLSYAAETAPFISIKITGLARFDLLAKLNTTVQNTGAGLSINSAQLTEAEKQEWKRVMERVDSICRAAVSHQVGVLIDAEESWIQQTIDAIAENMMSRYNTERAIVFNTIQFYCTRSLAFLKESTVMAKAAGYFLGVKIVRGAYMEKERARALQLNYPSPIQPDKETTDTDFNLGLAYCIKNVSYVSLVVASHNEQSNLLAAELLEKYGVRKNYPHIHFSQLYGMSDHITFNLAKAGFSVSKYLPYGSVQEVVPYLMRRAQENTSVAGQTARELFLIQTELKRRAAVKNNRAELKV